MNPTTEANERAWAKYMGSQPFKTHREDFDNGWDAALAWLGVDKHRATHMALALETLARSPLEYIGTLTSEQIQAIAEEGLTGHDTRGAAAPAPTEPEAWNGRAYRTTPARALLTRVVFGADVEWADAPLAFRAAVWQVEANAHPAA